MDNNNKPRLGMTQIESNVLMTQIRAQRKNFQARRDPIYIGSHRDSNNTGKKIFKQFLYHTTVLFRQPEAQRRKTEFTNSPTPSKSKGKRTGYNMIHKQSPLTPSRGRKKVLRQQNMNCPFDQLISFDPHKKIDLSPTKFSKRRYDHSPNNQNRLSPGFNLFKSHN